MGDSPATEQLVRRAQAGEVRAFEVLVEAHLPQVRRFARAFARDHDVADDLAQEALIKVYRSLGRYRFEASFSTWLFTVIRSSFLDARKSGQRRERALASAPPGRAVETPHEALERGREREALWQAIASVPVELRTSLVLCDVEGMSYEEVAVIERVPMGTVKSRLHRARERLRALLQSEAPARRSSL